MSNRWSFCHIRQSSSPPSPHPSSYVYIVRWSSSLVILCRRVRRGGGKGRGVGKIVKIWRNDQRLLVWQEVTQDWFWTSFIQTYKWEYHTIEISYNVFTRFTPGGKFSKASCGFSADQSSGEYLADKNDTCKLPLTTEISCSFSPTWRGALHGCLFPRSE